MSNLREVRCAWYEASRNWVDEHLNIQEGSLFLFHFGMFIKAPEVWSILVCMMGLDHNHNKGWIVSF